jgi:hypothetical protein
VAVVVLVAVAVALAVVVADQWVAAVAVECNRHQPNCSVDDNDYRFNCSCTLELTNFLRRFLNRFLLLSKDCLEYTAA